MELATTKIQLEFEFVGGQLCLDFNNTYGGLRLGGPQERLTSYPKLVSWGRQAGLISEGEAALLLQKAMRTETEAAAVLERAYALREAICGIFTTRVLGELPAQNDLDILNRELAQGMNGGCVIVTKEGFGWHWPKKEEVLDQMLGPVVRSAATLLTSDELKFVRKCANEDCRWLFMDTTKNHRRQWCMTGACGNRDRVRRHRQRQLSIEKATNDL